MNFDTQVLQIVGMGLFTFAASIGSYLGGRRSYNAQISQNAKQVSDGWEALYRVSEEKNKQLNARIDQLVTESHAKDVIIAQLSGKIDTLMALFHKAVDKTALLQDFDKSKG